MGEVGEAHPRVDAEQIAHIVIVLDVDGGLMGAEFRRGIDVEFGIATGHIHGTGCVDMVGIVDSILQFMTNRRVLVEVQLDPIVLDAAAQPELEVILASGEAELIIAEDGGGVEE